jgi:hypothetical protein
MGVLTTHAPPVAASNGEDDVAARAWGSSTRHTAPCSHAQKIVESSLKATCISRRTTQSGVEDHGEVNAKRI